MCRIAGYLGPPLPLAAFITTPPHSLYKQSWAAKELVTAKVNADGYGIAWLADDNRPANYRNIMPIWADPNLPHLQRSLKSRVWLGNVRSATEGLATHLDNTQPFISGQLLFTHNGFINDFSVSARRQIREVLDPEIEADIQGNTDSEYLFALFRQQQHGMKPALIGTLQWLRDLLKNTDTKALLNVIVSDGNALVAARMAINADSPSLYFHECHPQLDNGRVIASEPFDDDPDWRSVPANHLLELSFKNNAVLEAL